MKNPFDLKKMREDRKSINDEMIALSDQWTDENPPTNEALKLFDEKKSIKDKLSLDISAAERKESLSIDTPTSHVHVAVSSSSNKPSQKDMAMAFSAWALHQARKDVPSNFRDAADRCEISLHKNTFALDFTSPVTTPENAVSANVIQGVELARDAQNQLRQAVNVITTDKGGKLPWAYIDDLAVSGVATDKNGGGYTNAGFTVAEKSVEDYLITTGVFDVPQPWLTDSGMYPQILNLIGKRLGRAEVALCGSTGRGSASKEPLALTSQVTPTLFYPSTGSVEFYDVLQALQGEAGVYSDAPGAGYLMDADMWSAILRTVDGIGRPIFVDTVAVQGKRTVLSKPVYIVPGLGDTILYGDLKEIVLRQVGSTEIFVDPYTKRISNNCIQFGGNERVDIVVVDPLAIVAADANTGSYVNCGLYSS